MASTSILVLVLLAAGAFGKDCDKDKCYSVVSSNRFQTTTARSSGCSSFLSKTVTPAIVTKTFTAQGSNTFTPNTSPCPTTSAAPSRLPAYASSACTNTVTYSSACGCLGITGGTTTIAACTTTIVVRPTSSTSLSIHASSTIRTTSSRQTNTSSSFSKPTSSSVSTKTTSSTTLITASSSSSFLTQNSLSSATTSSQAPSTSSYGSLPPPAPCDNTGLDWAYFPIPTSPDPLQNCSGFNPGRTDFLNPSYTSTLPYLQALTFPAKASSGVFYSQTNQSLTSPYALNHQTYFFAPVSGMFTFYFLATGYVSFWLGPEAASSPENWSPSDPGSNDGWIVSGSAKVTGCTSKREYGYYQTDLVAGMYYPLRFVYAPGKGGQTDFSFSIFSPQGYELLGPGPAVKEEDRGYLVRESCDDEEPEMIPFGVNYYWDKKNCGNQGGCLDGWGYCGSC